MLQSVQFAVALLQPLTQLLILSVELLVVGLELVQSSENLEPLLAREGDRTLVLWGEKKP